MFLDFLYCPAKINHKPYLMFFEAMILTIISTILSCLIFPKALISLGILMFITIGSLPLLSKVFSYNSYLSTYKQSFFKRHSSLIKILAYFFLGVFFAYVCIFFISSLNYNMVDFNDSQVVYLDNYNDSSNYKMKINIVDFYKQKAVNILLLDASNKEIESRIYNIGDYISFNTIDMKTSFLITDIKPENISVNYGNTLREHIFFTQFSEMEGVSDLKANITGNLSTTDINAKNNNSSTNNSSTNVFKNVFNIILKNNLNVVLIAALLSFLYGAGAIFLISWNASILAAVVSLDIFLGMAPVITSQSFGFLKGIFNSIYLLLGYLPHGIPEIIAYFLVSIAGAVFSRDLVKGLLSTQFKWKILLDIFYLIIIAIILIIIGALIESSYFL